MLPVLQGVIARRVLLNFRADPKVVQRLLPEPFEVETYQRCAIVGVCLIRLQQVRPRGLPARIGFSSDNMAHRVAVHYPTAGKIKRGVFIWRRETDQRLVRIFGGRLFPGVHHGAKFLTAEDEEAIRMNVSSDDGETDVSFSACYSRVCGSGSAFKNLDEASQFFQHGDCGFSCSLHGHTVEGMQLKILQWDLKPLDVRLQKAAFYSNPFRFPQGSVEFDCGLMMRAIPHEWHQIREVPELLDGSDFRHPEVASTSVSTAAK